MTKIIPFDHKKRKTRDTIRLLKDRKRVIKAIEEGVCLLCGRKTSLFKEMGFITAFTSGLCPLCFRKLSPEERLIANSEASHKKIFLKVIDDRDNDNNKG